MSESKAGSFNHGWWIEKGNNDYWYQYSDIYVEYSNKEVWVCVNPEEFEGDYTSDFINVKTGKTERITFHGLGDIDKVIRRYEISDEIWVLLNHIKTYFDHKFKKEILEKLITPDK